MTAPNDRAPTATLFNYSCSVKQPDKPTSIPPAIRKIVIVGGGSAGWMTAMILANALISHGIEISVLESPMVGIIGVGEGSTPWLRGFFDSLGIEESEWMPECNATYKCGITFDDWSTKPGFEIYFHPFASMRDNLSMTQFLHNAQISTMTPIINDNPSQTITTALKHGCRWKIPLTSRYGNGYVYSSAFCSADDAEHELRVGLGMLDSDTPARHLKMKIGRVTKHWNRNCLAVGLAQGFIEPLEATALLFIQRTVTAFVEFLEVGDLSEAAHERFNQRVNDHFEGTRDYIVTHYKTNTRRDTEYWRANAANTNLSDSLRQLYGLWMSGKSIAADVGRQAIGKGYPVFSWYCIMSGMGIFPDPKDLRPAAPPDNRYSMEEIDNLLQRSTLNFRSQRDVLMNIPQKVQERSLQIYFW